MVTISHTNIINTIVFLVELRFIYFKSVFLQLGKKLHATVELFDLGPMANHLL
jgi:hypothetical protein